MKTPETREKDEIKKYLKSIGAWFIVTRMTGYGTGGQPDIVGILPGGQGFTVEVKREGKEPTPRQEMRMEEVRAAGGWAFAGTAERVIGDLQTLRAVQATKAIPALRFYELTSELMPGNIHPCPACSRMFKDGETCHMGGCPMGGDF